MIYEHIRTGVKYRKLFDSFSVERQRHSVIFMSLETGQVFDRDAVKFGLNFRKISEDPNLNIQPRLPHD